MPIRPSAPGACARIGGFLALVYPALAAGEPPRLDRDKPFACMTDAEGRKWRVQCAPDDAPPETRMCLYAPDAERDVDGGWAGALDRARPCWSTASFDRTSLQTRGFKLVEAVADAPWGWERDERGRVMQVSFDLQRRLWIGAAWMPVVDTGDDLAAPAPGGRLGIDFGLFAWTGYSGGRNQTDIRHRVGLFQGNVTVAPFGARVVAVHYDNSVRYETPLLRLTTFVGKPRRHDAHLNIGLWTEAGDLEIHATPAGDEQLWRFATVHATADLWQSADLYSFVRVRAGIGWERAFVPDGEGRDALTPGAAFEADLTLDTDGRHRAVAKAVYETPIYVTTDPQLGTRAVRLDGEVGYEWVFIAANDQPFSIRAAVGAGWRDDVPGLDPRLAFRATLGLRFSLWAPARARTPRE